MQFVVGLRLPFIEICRIVYNELNRTIVVLAYCKLIRKNHEKIIFSIIKCINDFYDVCEWICPKSVVK